MAGRGLGPWLGVGRMKKVTRNTTAAPVGRKGATAAASPSSERRADFETLYQRHSREVWALAYARWMNADTALDITQEAFLRLWKQLELGDTILNPRAGLWRVAQNLAEYHAKSAVRRNGTHGPQTMNGVLAHNPPPLE